MHHIHTSFCHDSDQCLCCSSLVPRTCTRLRESLPLPPHHQAQISPEKGFSYSIDEGGESPRQPVHVVMKEATYRADALQAHACAFPVVLAAFVITTRHHTSLIPLPHTTTTTTGKIITIRRIPRTPVSPASPPPLSITRRHSLQKTSRTSSASLTRAKRCEIGRAPGGGTASPY